MQPLKCVSEMQLTVPQIHGKAETTSIETFIINYKKNTIRPV